jgi:hypothetical protein
MHKGFRDLPVLFAGCCQFDLEHLLKNPAQLGAFLSVCKTIRDLEPEARTAAINLALSGEEISGFTLVRHESGGYIENGTLSELFSGCPLAKIPALLAGIVKILGHLSADHYRELCAIIGTSPIQSAIKHAGANPFLRQNA